MYTSHLIHTRIHKKNDLTSAKHAHAIALSPCIIIMDAATATVCKHSLLSNPARIHISIYDFRFRGASRSMCLCMSKYVCMYVRMNIVY